MLGIEGSYVCMFGARRAEAGIYVWKRAVARLGRTWEDCQAGY